MPHRPVTDSPTAGELDRQELEDSGPVTRREFRSLRNDVHEIKTALIGNDLVDGGGVLEQHREMRKRVAVIMKLAWVVTIGVLGAIGLAAWNVILSGKHL